MDVILVMKLIVIFWPYIEKFLKELDDPEKKKEIENALGKFAIEGVLQGIVRGDLSNDKNTASI